MAENTPYLASTVQHRPLQPSGGNSLDEQALFSIDSELDFHPPQQPQPQMVPPPPPPRPAASRPATSTPLLASSQAPPLPQSQQLLLQQQQQQLGAKKRQRSELENLQLAAAQLRREKIARFVAKRPFRKYNRKGETRYEIRKDFASSRKRVKGRFVAKGAPRLELAWKRRDEKIVGPQINWDRETTIAVKPSKAAKEDVSPVAAAATTTTTTGG